MRHFITFLLVAVATLNTYADKAYSASRFFDNWSVGAEVGLVGATQSDEGNCGTRFGLTLTRQLTPLFALQIEGLADAHYALPAPVMVPQASAIDASHLNLNALFNLSNAFGGYKGKPRLFEVEAMAGAGWQHAFAPHQAGYNYMTSKFGLNLNLNLGKQRAWVLGLRPAINYVLTPTTQSHVAYDVRRSELEFTLHAAYRFRCSNGTHGIKSVRPYDKSEVDRLNAQIKDLRKTLSEREAELSNSRREVRKLQDTVNDLRDQMPIVKK